jgi:hypothetical protein
VVGDQDYKLGGLKSNESRSSLGSLIFKEEVNEEFLKGMFLKTIRAERIERWEYRCFGTLAVFSACLFIFGGKDVIGTLVVVVILLFFASILLINAEVGRIMITRSTKSIEIFEHGVKIYAFPRERKKGFDGVIYRDQIASAYVRNKVGNRGEWFTRLPIMRLGFAERELMERGYQEMVFCLKNGRHYHSGAKSSETIIYAKSILNQWKLM